MKKALICLLCIADTRIFGQGLSLTSLSNGRFVACWDNWGQYDSEPGIYGQLFASNGTKAGGEFRIYTYSEIFLDQPQIASLTGGGFVVYWTSYYQDGSGEDVFGQVFASDGTREGEEFCVNTYTEDDQADPQIASLPEGGFVVCWDSNGQEGDGSEVYGQLFASNGNMRGDEFRINTHTAYSQHTPRLTEFADGGFAVCWNEYWEDVRAYGANGQAFSSDGSRTGQEFRINTYPDDQFLDPLITSLASGDFAICWASDGHTGPGMGVYGRVFDSNGNKTSQEFFIPVIRRDNFIYPAIRSLPAGGFVVYWESDGPDGSSWYAKGQVVAANGSMTGQTFSMNADKQNYRLYPQMAPLPDGGFMACWIAVGPDGTGNVYGRTYSLDGNPTCREFRINTDRNCQPTMPGATSLSNGGLAVCWFEKVPDGYNAVLNAKLFPGFPIVHALQPFGLIEPSNDHTLKTCEFTFIWRQPDNQPVCYGRELNYQLFIDENPGFLSPRIIDQDMDTSAVVKGLKRGATYFWKVLAKNITGDSLWSANTNAFFV